MYHTATVHFAGYEFARCGIMALFTSDRTGFTQTSMVTLATALVSPFSLAVLWVRVSAALIYYRKSRIISNDCGNSFTKWLNVGFVLAS